MSREPSRLRRALVLLATLPIADLATAQLTGQDTLPAHPAFASDPPEAPPSALGAETPRQNREGQAPATLPADLPDTVPLPEEGILVAGADGDRRVVPAGGDPFFLGFAAGPYYPPENERIDPLLLSRAATRSLHGRTNEEVFAFVMLQRRITDERRAELASLGVRVLDFHPHYCLKVALPNEAIGTVAALSYVRWIGVPRDWQKLHPNLFSANEGNARLEVYVDLFDSDLGPQSTSEPVGSVSELDAGVVQPARESAAALPRRWMSHGWKQRALESLGVEILEYAEGPRAFAATCSRESVAALAELDFVQFIEPRVPSRAQHDESTPMILSDYVRAQFDGGTSGAAIVGVADSGIRHSHQDLDHVWGVGWDFTPIGDPWVDGHGHGSHVTGTILGNGDVAREQTGNAPGLGYSQRGRVFDAKILGNDGFTPSNFSIQSLASVLHTAYTDDDGVRTPRPHVINNSWGAAPGSQPWVGSEFAPRVIDDEVYDYEQVWVFAAGNSGSGSSTLGQQATAKNALTVGAVSCGRLESGDPGALAGFSSRGPTGDGRWKPNLVAPGDRIRSVDARTTTGYTYKSGTSMAAPHVTGVIAQLVDSYAFLRYEPARIASILMATAVTRDNALLTAETDTHLDRYGAGRVEAFRAMYGNSQMSWTNWGYDHRPGYWSYGDFTVGSGATRLIVCLAYTEPSASSGASPVLRNDVNLVLDRAPLSSAGDSGDYAVHQSGRDNTEIRILDNPASGAWRWKAWPSNVHETCHSSVTVAVIYGDTTPNGSLGVHASDTYLRVGENVDVTATVTNPAYIASAVYLDQADFGSLQRIVAARTTLMDGTLASLTDNFTGGRDVLLGDLPNGTSRSVRWTLNFTADGIYPWSVQARSDNWVDRTAGVTLYVDSTPPGAPDGLFSSSHSPDVWSNDASLDLEWGLPLDNVSGNAGMAVLVSSNAPATPAPSVNTPVSYAYSTVLATSSTPYFFNARLVDNSGNWGPSASLGGFLIDTVAPGSASGLASSSHAVDALSHERRATITWTAASDAHSGVAGYVTRWTHRPWTNPAGPIDVAAPETSQTTVLEPSIQPWYFHVRACDRAGNLGPASHAGPFYVHSKPLGAQ